MLIIVDRFDNCRLPAGFVLMVVYAFMPNKYFFTSLDRSLVVPTRGARSRSSFDNWARALVISAETNEFSSFALARRITSGH